MRCAIQMPAHPFWIHFVQKLNFYQCFDGHMFCPEKDDLILFPIEWNVFLLLPALEQIFDFQPTFVVAFLKARDKNSSNSTRHKKLCNFIFMHNHRIVYSVFWLKPDCIWNCNGVVIQSIYQIDSKWIQAWTLHAVEAARPYRVKIFPWKSAV